MDSWFHNLMGICDSAFPIAFRLDHLFSHCYGSIGLEPPAPHGRKNCDCLQLLGEAIAIVSFG